MTLNSALSQNWVMCTMRTPKIQIAHELRDVVCATGSTTSLLRARYVLLVTTRPGSLPLSRPKTMLRPPSRPNQVVTSKRGRDTHFNRPGHDPTSTLSVVTPKPCRDTPQQLLLYRHEKSCCDLEPACPSPAMSRPQFDVVTWDFLQLAQPVS